MERPHYLRFARALTLAAVATGCGARTESDERYGLDAASDGPSDNGTDAVVLVDTATAIGACRNFGASAVTCAPGGTCVLPIGSAGPDCRYNLTGAPMCGVIFCGDGCYCSPTTPNACDCARAVEGPLPPPDLPSA
jgi:hypothetical protein